MDYQSKVTPKGQEYVKNRVMTMNCRSLRPPTNYREVKNDPLQAYIKKCLQYPLLTKKEQERLFWRYIELGDESAKDLITVSNLRLVIKIALKYQKFTYSPPIDLIQEGNLGLIRAAEKYDPNRGAKFSYYASFWIKACIMRHIMNNWSLVKGVTSMPKRSLFSKMKKEKLRMAELGIEPTVENLSNSLKFKEKDVQDIEMLLENRDVSLDEPVSKNSDTNWIDCMPSDINTEELVCHKDQREKGIKVLRLFRKELSFKELFIFDNRICCEDPATLQDIGDAFSLSRERVRQLEKRIYNKLQRYIDTGSTEERRSLKRDGDLNDVTVSEIMSVTRRKGKTREVALLYFGLKNMGYEMMLEDITIKTGWPQKNIRQAINKVQRNIEKLRGKGKDRPSKVKTATNKTCRRTKQSGECKTKEDIGLPLSFTIKVSTKKLEEMDITK